MTIKRRPGIPAVRRAPVAAPGAFKHLEYMKTKKWPDPVDMKKAPSVVILQVASNPGSEGTVERELVDSFESVKRERGIQKAAVYKLVRGSEDAPDHLFVLIADNPGVVKRLHADSRFKTRENKIRGLAKSFAAPEISRTLIGRVEE